MSGKLTRDRLKRHAIQRARERYDVWLEMEDIGALNSIIRAGLGRPFGKGKRGAEKFFVTSLCGATLPAVYLRHRNCIGTFLPWDSSEVTRALARRAE